MAIAGRLDPRNNSLNFLRLVFALLVIESHAWPLGGFGSDPQFCGATLGAWAVGGFFAISGYLITSSRQRTAFPNFLVRRVLRIYPAYVVCLMLVAFVFAPLSTTLGRGSIHWGSACAYVFRNIFLKNEQNGIDNTLGTLPYPGVWNGSLWTLFYEFACYLLVGAAIFTLNARIQRYSIAAMFGMFVGGYLFLTEVAHHRSGSLFDLLSLGAIFFAGALFAVWQDHVRYTWYFGVPALGLTLLGAQLHLMSAVSALPLAYACLWLGADLPLARIGRTNDISYGIYIYAFPVQQLVQLAHGGRLGPITNSVLTTVITVPLAALSWWLIEKPGLRGKRRADELIHRWGSTRRNSEPIAVPATTTLDRAAAPAALARYGPDR